jgi:hypothetical protein
MSDTFATVRADADPECRICDGIGWHWGWDLHSIGRGRGRRLHGSGDPLHLRCPCVDRRRAERTVRTEGEAA